MFTLSSFSPSLLSPASLLPSSLPPSPPPSFLIFLLLSPLSSSSFSFFFFLLSSSSSFCLSLSLSLQIFQLCRFDLMAASDTIDLSLLITLLCFPAQLTYSCSSFISACSHLVCLACSFMGHTWQHYVASLRPQTYLLPVYTHHHVMPSNSRAVNMQTPLYAHGSPLSIPRPEYP